ncbi:molybdopterin molybdotransferase MoeA [Marivirga harenae]|uniref:molybdopterin molybdotransferase MoeA n=1 Tax=Marivirga harenae TaxID=2010992 RepID=UPI0026E10C05|nr:gephyrin-like molybdotransferase Glp [Marivirga harenae]WKV12436.1 molybdopterin molybdotransferase MoeA [Marivirga harenae]
MNITEILITVEKAISLIKENVQCTSKTEMISIEKAKGYVLAEDIAAPINLPPFRQSAMDGYALHLSDTDTYTVRGEIKAGDVPSIDLSAGEAVRIFTGAQVPTTADTVVKQELTAKDKNTIRIEGEITLGSNIRPIGEQIKKDTLALPKQTTLFPSTLGYLAGLGITQVLTYKKPTVAIVVTGNELVEIGTPLSDGKVYESNAIMLKNALASLGIQEVIIQKVTDEYHETETILNKMLNNYDFTIVSGGISVGDYDFVGDALAAIGVDEVFYKVKQKPGKPLYFGKKNNRFAFALPGNPASALSCFYVYVALAITRYSGKERSDVLSQRLTAVNSFTSNGTRAQFLKALATAEKVEILDGQASSMLRSFAVANALVYLPEGEQTINKGSEVNVLLLPQ